MKKISLILVFLFFISGCSIYKLNATPKDVIQLPNDTRVWYQEGAFEKAKLISSILDAEVGKVVKMQYRPFRQPIRIYVFSKQKTFDEYAIHSKAGGETQSNKILISPKKANTLHRLPGLVAHELSHYNVIGYMGLYNYRITPRWFLEGLAVWVSDGAGAEGISRDDAIAAILLGDHINLVTRNPLLFGEKSKPSGMKPHMFYRQSALFVEYLHNLNPGEFKKLLLGIEDSGLFEKSFIKAYRKDPKILWSQFVTSLKNNKALNSSIGNATHSSA